MALEIANVLLRKNYRVIFVFDGRTDTPHPSYVKFSGDKRYGMTADEWIVEYVTFVERLSVSGKVYSGKEAVDTYDIQTTMLDEMEEFLSSLKRKKRRKRR